VTRVMNYSAMKSMHTVRVLPAGKVGEHSGVYIMDEVRGHRWRTNSVVVFHLLNVPKRKTWGWSSKSTSFELKMSMDGRNPPRKREFQEQKKR